MPNRALAVVTTRHHPIAVAFYLGIVALSLMSMTNLFSVQSMINEVGTTFTLIWKTMLLLGSVAAFVGVMLPKKQIVRGLRLETLGCFLTGAELMVYSGVMMGLDNEPWATIIVFGFLGIGCLARVWTAWRDKRRIIEAVNARGCVDPSTPGGLVHE